MSGPGAKKFFLAGPWDLEIATNVIMFERQPILFPHPHPEVEALRYNYVMKLRQSFQEMCHSREGELNFKFTLMVSLFDRMKEKIWPKLFVREHFFWPFSALVSSKPIFWSQYTSFIVNRIHINRGMWLSGMDKYSSLKVSVLPASLFTIRRWA